MSKVITPREEDSSAWYNDIVIKAGLAEHSSVRGCMVIKPYGFAIWEKMKEVLDARFKATGHVNAAFPLFIPKSFLSKEAAHVEGFAKECAVVTHYRLKNDPNGKGVIVDPEAKLEEELIVRPTSETIIWHSYKNWIKSYRDLPILINQWANVVRWEMRTRLFLRTAEFFWQEGHTAHETESEAITEAELMLKEYSDFMHNYLAIPVITGLKSESERFAGALNTYTTEGMMQDGKALQMGTSHYLGQNFSKAFEVRFQGRDGQMAHPYSTSWGVSTRMMGALVMAHSDNNGLVLPPKLAPYHAVFVPIFKNEAQQTVILEKAEELKAKLAEAGIVLKIDADDSKRPGYKFAEYELKGVPLRIALGPRDLENGNIEVARRDTGDKNVIPIEGAADNIVALLDEIQSNIYNKALTFRDEHTTEAKDFDQFKDILENKTGFVLANWDGTAETEDKIKDLTKATIRCIPMEGSEADGVDVFSGKEGKYKVLFAKAY